MINKDIFKQQQTLNPNAEMFFVLIKTDEYIDNYKLFELPEYLFDSYEHIEYRGIYPVVKYLNQL